ncbi:MAG: LysM peptidoglycan-binding domain-containing protein, partial [Victivallales bacterium]|nr:LysM peptidoglycan-binding domain-containing protein [Victivallales bacterium]
MPLLVFCPADTTRLLDALRRLEEFSSGDSPLDVTAVAAAAGRPVRVCTRRLLKENRVAFPVANSAYRYYLPPEELCRWLPDVAAGDGCPPKELFRWTKELLATPLFMPWESLRFLVLASSVHPWCNALKRLRRGAVYSEDELERLCDDLRQAASFGEERLVSQVQPPEAMPELAPVPLPEVPEGHPELPAIIHAGTLFVPCAFNDPAATILELHDELGESYGASGRLTIANDPAWRAFPLNAKVPFGRMFLGSLQAFGRRYNLRGESVSWEIEPPVTKTGEASPWFRIFLSLVLLCLGLGVGAYFFWGEHATVDNSPEEKPGGNLPEEKPGDNPPEGEPDGKPSEEKEPIPECGYIIIQAGDSTSSISERYGVAVEDLYKWNGYGELKVGDRYWLRESTPEELPLTPPPPPRLPIPECGYVIIQAGDDTSSISERYGVAVADLNKWNGSGRLEVGK